MSGDHGDSQDAFHQRLHQFAPSALVGDWDAEGRSHQRQDRRLGEPLDGSDPPPGDYVFVPPWVPHREENPDPAEEAVVVIARTTQEAIVVNVPDLTWKGPIATTGKVDAAEK